MMMMKCSGDYEGAQRLLTHLLDQKTGGHIPVRRLRAIAAAHAGKFDIARQDADFLRRRPGGSDMAHRIEARIKLVQGDYDGAEAELGKVRSQSVQDNLLRARILDARANDTLASLSKRDLFRRQAAGLRAQNRIVDEFELDG